MTTASNPRLASSAGATVVVAPFAQSIASLKPAVRKPALQPSWRFRKHRAQVIEIGADEIRLRNAGRLAVPRPPGRIGHDRLDLALHTLGKLLTTARKHLDAVVFERIVRSGNHDTRLVSSRPREIGNGRRRHDAGARHARAFSTRSVRKLHFDPGARLARITADQQPRRGRSGSARQRPHEGGPDTANRWRVERVHAGRAADTVGAEETRDFDGATGLSIRFQSFQFWALLIRTWIVWGSIRVTPASRELSARTVNM